MEDEPFDSAGPGVRKSKPSAPPAAAFGFSSTTDTPAVSDDEMQTIPVSPPSADLPDRWKQYDTQMEGHRSESALGGGSSSMMDETAPSTVTPTKSSYRLFETPEAKKPTRQPYSFRKTPSYDASRKSDSYNTNDLIKKYGAMTGMPPPSKRSSAPVSLTPAQTEEVRNQAMKVLDLVDDHLNTPLDVRRTESGGFRVAPSMGHESPYAVRRTSSGAIVVQEDVSDREPYMVRRTASGTITSGIAPANNAGGKRPPAALAGLFGGGSGNKGKRYSMSDSNFREDDHISDEEDDIMVTDSEPVVDIVKLESRAAANRASRGNPNDFDGDFPEGSSSWSNRYLDSYTSQKRLLDKWDREYARDRQSARNMIMSTASNMKSAANNMWTEAQSQSEKVFGPGFSFRKNHIFGQQSGDDKPEVNLRTVWKDDEDDTAHGPKRVHRSWQEVMLSKRKRRKICCLILLFLLIMTVVVTITLRGARSSAEIKSTGHDIGSPVTFYVTSDVPYDAIAEEKMSKDIANIPGDAEFIVHLGNIQEASVTFCPTSRYTDVASLLQKSPVPVFVLPGEEDWTQCPNPSDSFEDWVNAFGSFDSYFNHGFDLFRDRENPEAFAMLHKGVLFMGLHIVSGPFIDEDERSARENEMLTFYFGMTNLYKGQFRSIVLLGNAKPSPMQDDFFNSIFTSLKPIGKPVAYIHANSGTNDIMEYSPFEDQPLIYGIEIENGGRNPPLRIVVSSGDRPFLVG